MLTNSHDVVFLFGPPIQVAFMHLITIFGNNPVTFVTQENKASCLPSSFFREDFTVISPEQIFKDNPSLGLRDVTLNVVSALREKKQVFIEDEFRLKNTRSSILNTLKKKVPQSSMLLLKIIPKYGLRQICWSHQFSFAQQKILTGNYGYRQIKQWFDESQLALDTDSDYVDWPDRREGFDIQEVIIPLQVPSNLKFQIPCLLIQWEAAISPLGDFSSSLQEAFLKWKSNSENGRIIFIYDGKNLAKGYVTERDEDALIKRQMSVFALKANYPVYVLSVKSMSKASTFCMPPQPGILAFLQLQHCIDFHSKQTVYIYETAEHMNMALSAGIRHIKGSKSEANPSCIFKRPAAVLRVPALLKDMTYLEDEELQTDFTLPLYDQCAMSQQGNHTSQLYENGLNLSVFVPSMEVFLRIQGSLRTSLKRSQTTTCDESRLEETQLCPTENMTRSKEAAEMDENLPVWMGKRLQRESTLDSVSSVENQSSSEPSTSYRCSKTVYVMTEKELHELALQVLAQAGKDVEKDNDVPSVSLDQT